MPGRRIDDWADAVAILRQIHGRHLNAPNEDALQRAVHSYLCCPPHELDAVRELRLGPHERVDVAIVIGDPHVPEPQILAIEIKLEANATPVLRQLQRYAAHGRVVGVALISTSRRLGLSLGDMREVGGKPFYNLGVRRF